MKYSINEAFKDLRNSKQNLKEETTNQNYHGGYIGIFIKYENKNYGPFNTEEEAKNYFDNNVVITLKGDMLEDCGMLVSEAKDFDFILRGRKPYTASKEAYKYCAKFRELANKYNVEYDLHAVSEYEIKGYIKGTPNSLINFQNEMTAFMDDINEKFENDECDYNYYDVGINFFN